MKFAAAIMRYDHRGQCIPCQVACRIRTPDTPDPATGAIQSHLEIHFGKKWRRVWIGGHHCLTFVHLWNRQIEVEIRRKS